MEKCSFPKYNKKKMAKILSANLEGVVKISNIV